MEDAKISSEDQRLLALTEHPIWGAFVRMVEEDMNRLDTISSLVLDGSKSKEQIADEVLLRYQTRDAIISYVNQTIERAEQALTENQEIKSDIIKFHS